MMYAHHFLILPWHEIWAFVCHIPKHAHYCVQPGGPNIPA